MSVHSHRGRHRAPALRRGLGALRRAVRRPRLGQHTARYLEMTMWPRVLAYTEASTGPVAGDTGEPGLLVPWRRP